ncbi:hypothetical protein RhiLY_09203 [Ceratobasidium sp. AG-Ba]|nr:hypothetical protein RhiLY_09203 [Ceratobasidium sp. AG-Ba]
MLEPLSFLTVGALPNLRRLRINGSYAHVGMEPDKVPPGSFPALRELHVCELDSATIISILGTRPLVKNLINLRINYRPEDFELAGIQDRAGYIASTLLGGLRNATSLRSFELLIDLNGVIEDPYDIGHRDLLKTFSKLELEKITLEGAHVGRWACNLNTLGTVWSDMTSISIEDQVTSLDAFICFAQLPRLQHLLLNVRFVAVGRVPEAGSMSPLHTLECSGKVLEEQPSEGLVTLTSEFLLILFLSLHQIRWADGWPDRSKEHQDFFHALNQNITLRRL